MTGIKFKNIVQGAIAYLEQNHLNHAAIVLLGMWPMIHLNILLGGGEWTAAMMWLVAYYAREVSMGYHLGPVRMFYPWAWAYHDWVQTLWAAIAAFAFALVWSW